MHRLHIGIAAAAMRTRYTGRRRLTSPTNVPICTRLDHRASYFRQVGGKVRACPPRSRRQTLPGLLSSDAELLSDGSGVLIAAPRPIPGLARILRFLDGLRQKYTSTYRARVVQCNGMPALALLHGDTLDGLLTCEVRAGHVVRLMLLRNPHTLDGLRQALQQALQQPVTC